MYICIYVHMYICIYVGIGTGIGIGIGITRETYRALEERDGVEGFSHASCRKSFLLWVLDTLNA